MAAPKDKGIALILGMGKPPPEADGEDIDDMEQARINCASTMIDAIRSDDPEGFAQALNDFLELR